MAVSLIIEREGAARQVLPFAGQDTVQNLLRPLGQAFGLQYVPNLSTSYPIERGELGKVTGELRVLRCAVEARFPDRVSLRKNLDGIIDALTALSGQRDWNAYFS